jgi:hypothetical protein
MRRPYLDPAEDFQDEGGTPAYRQRLLLDSAGPFKKWYRKASPLDVFLLAFLVPLGIGLLAYPVGLTLIFIASKL